MYRQYADIGRLWLPQPAISLPGRSTKLQRVNVVVASQRRSEAVARGLVDPAKVTGKTLAEILRQLDPKYLLSRVIWASVSANSRINDGQDIQQNRMLGTVSGSQTANGVFTAVAVATTGFTTITATDSSIGVDAQGQTTNEFTTVGLSRAAGTVQNYSPTRTIDATFACDVYKQFTVSGAGGTAHGSALFDSLTPAGSWLFVEAAFGADAVLVATDLLQVTWTVTT